MTGTRIQPRMHASESELLMVSCHKSSQCCGNGHCLSMSEMHMSTEVGCCVHRWLLRSVIKSRWVVHDLKRVHPMVVCRRVRPIILGGIQVDVVTMACPVHQ